MTPGSSNDWSVHRIPASDFPIGVFAKPITPKDLQRLAPRRTRPTLEQLLLRTGAVLLGIAVGGFGLAHLAKAGDERLWSDA